MLVADEGTSGRSWIRKLAMPWFITLFLAVMALNSIVTVPAPVAHACLILSKALLLLAATATAMRSRLDLIMQMGWRAAMPVVAATVASLLVAIGFGMIIL